MGCGSSAPQNQVTPSHEPKPIQNGHGPITTDKEHDVNEEIGSTDSQNSDNEALRKVRSPTPIPLDEEKRGTKTRPVSTDTNGNRRDVIVETHEVPKAVSFEVTMNGTGDYGIKKPPKRFQSLEPLNGAPKLTAEMLEAKLKTAESKRQQEIEKVVSASRKSSSKRRRELLAAKEFEKEQQIYSELEEKSRSADKNREARQKEIIDKQKRRHERARLARERARRQQQMDDEEVELDVEKDETFNADDDDDSWLDGDTDTLHSDLTGSGREDHRKSAKSATYSANTLDSSDDKLKRNSATHNSEKDEFFDS